MNPVMTMAIAIIDVPMSLAPDSRELSFVVQWGWQHC
jgi:hypothetical protein